MRSRDRDWTRSHWPAVGSQHASLWSGFRLDGGGGGRLSRPPLGTATSVCCSPSCFLSVQLETPRPPVAPLRTGGPASPAGLSAGPVAGAATPTLVSVFVAGSPLRLLARAAELVGPQIGFQMLVGRAPCWDQGVSPLCHSLECLLPQCTEPLTGHLLPSQAACDAHGLGGLLAWPVTAPAAQVEVTVSQGGSLGLPLSSPRASPANPPCVRVCMRVRCMHTCVHVCYL